MAKGANNKLMKLKSVLKRLNSFNNKHNHHHQPATPQMVGHVRSSAVSAIPGGDLRTVYVGRTRRPYHVSSDVVSHPLFQQIADFSAGDDGEISVSCEVVLFEHLLWMLEDADESHPESLRELVEFYAG